MNSKIISTWLVGICFVAMSIVVGARTPPTIEQDDKQAKPPTVTSGGLEITLLSFERAPSRAVSLGGKCPPGGVVGTVQGVLNEGRALLIAKVKIKVLPTYKAERDLKIFLIDDQDEKHETVMSLGDFGNPGKEPEYECAFQFVGPENAKYQKLQIGAAALSLELQPK